MSLTVIKNGTVVLPDRLAYEHDVVVSAGRIVCVVPTGSKVQGVCESIYESIYEGTSGDTSVDAYSDACKATCSGTLGDTCRGTYRDPYVDGDGDLLSTVVDATGCYVAPGFIDIHSDYIETMASPRPSVVMDLQSALYETDRVLASCGVTTMFHSLSVYKMLVFDHKPIRCFDNVLALIKQINEMRATEALEHLVRHRLHVRVELDAVDRFLDIENMLLAGKIDLISFMDHTPGQGQYHDLEVFAKTIKSYKGEMSVAVVKEIIEKQQASAKLSFEQIAHLAGVAQSRGISIATHDDDSKETLELMSSLGASISEFPTTIDVARYARHLGIHTLAGAPNVLLGHSHSGNLSARESICDGSTDILCSDYFPAALLAAVFELNRSCNIGLPEAFALVTQNPARAVGLDAELGSIAAGKRADILLIRELKRENVMIPIIEEVFVDGKAVFSMRYPQAFLG